MTAGVSTLESTNLHRTLVNRYEFVVGHTWTILSEQLDDVDDSDEHSSETYDVEEVMAVATVIKLYLRPNVGNTRPSSARLLRAVHWDKETKKETRAVFIKAYLSLLSSLVSNSCTWEFCARYLYCQIPLLVNSYNPFWLKICCLSCAPKREICDEFVTPHSLLSSVFTARPHCSQCRPLY